MKQVAKVVQVARDAAVLLFSELGIVTANKWNSKRISAKLNKLTEMVDKDTVVCDEAAPTLQTVLQAIKDNIDIEVVAEVTTPPEPEKAPSRQTDVEEFTGKRTKKPTKKEQGVKKVNPTPGVRPSESRPYFAGMVLRKHGLDKGITQEMVDELNVLYGKKNDHSSYQALYRGWHIVRGYLSTAKK